MNYKVYLTETFQKSVKILKKKYRKVKADIAGTIHVIEEDPTIGDPIPGWNKEIWKVRTASSDVKKGTRGGSVDLPLKTRRNHCLYVGSIF